MNVLDFTAKELDCMNLVATLIPKTKRGKQRIKQWGKFGKVLRVKESVLFSQERGRWFAVCAGDSSYRWVNFSNDKDFDMIIDGWNGNKSIKTHNTT